MCLVAQGFVDFHGEPRKPEDSTNQWGPEQKNKGEIQNT